MATSVRDAEARLAVPPHPGGFSSSELFGVPDTAASMLTAAIESGTPLAAAARIEMRGWIRLNRWLPFRASQVIAPGQGFVWVARVAGLIEGHDLFIDGAGEMEWKLLRLFSVARGAGTDVSRSAAGREAGEAFWLPTTLLPRFGVEWTATADGQAVARVPTSTETIDVTYDLDEVGRVESIAFQRWGDPQRTGSFALHTFGGTMSDYRRFEGVTIPTRGSVGWHFGEPDWTSGEFFRFQITDLRLVK